MQITKGGDETYLVTCTEAELLDIWVTLDEGRYSLTHLYATRHLMRRLAILVHVIETALHLQPYDAPFTVHDEPTD